MMYQIYSPEGQCKFKTQYEECIPKDQIETFFDAGYYFKIDSKTVSAKQIREMFKTKEAPKSLMIHCIETDEFFNKQSEAAKKYNIDPAQVSDSIKTGRKRSGYTFEKVYA